MPLITRRAFVASSSLVTVLPVAPMAAAAAMQGEPGAPEGLPAYYPSHSRDAVRGIVGKSHFDYDTVRAMVIEQPELAKAAWDWGFGDWESALGAASHMGRRDIAEVLIEHGARPDLFTFAMLGQLEIVRATCEANLGIQRTPGPHGITLLQHARHGGEAAASVAAYLETLGDADDSPVTAPLSEADAQPYIGAYVPAGAPDVRFHVEWFERRKVLTLKRDDEQFRMLLHHGEHRFSPGGAASVRVVFQTDKVEVRGLTIHDGPTTITARRVS